MRTYYQEQSPLAHQQRQLSRHYITSFNRRGQVSQRPSVGNRHIDDFIDIVSNPERPRPLFASITIDCEPRDPETLVPVVTRSIEADPSTVTMRSVEESCTVLPNASSIINEMAPVEPTEKMVAEFAVSYTMTEAAPGEMVMEDDALVRPELLTVILWLSAIVLQSLKQFGRLHHYRR